jgi:hypothetical protein
MAKGRQKPKPPMYTPKQRMAYVACKCDPRGRAPDESDKKLSGGFNTSRKNLCTGCGEYKSVNGACGCP